MPLYDFFKNLFNIKPGHPTNEGLNNSNDDPNKDTYNFWGPNADHDEQLWREVHDHTNRPDQNMRNFNVFTDPLEMHRYFEQQMEEMLKSFGGFFGPGMGSGFFGGPGLFGPNSEVKIFGPNDGGEFFGPSTEPPMIEPPQNGSLRDRFLKPGYDSKHDDIKRDHVLDDRTINTNDLDQLLKEKHTQTPEQERPVTPYQHQPLMPKIRSFGQSMSSKTIRRPDGSIEIHKTIRDSAGNEENVVTRQIGDKQYTITVRTDKQGRQEKCEDLVNMDEKDLPKFKDYWSRGQTQLPPNHPSIPDDPYRLFPFYDKFFK